MARRSPDEFDLVSVSLQVRSCCSNVRDMGNGFQKYGLRSMRLVNTFILSKLEHCIDHQRDLPGGSLVMAC